MLENAGLCAWGGTRLSSQVSTPRGTKTRQTEQVGDPGSEVHLGERVALPARVSRRSVFHLAGITAAIGVTGVNVLGPALAAHSNPPADAAGVITLARSYLGQGLVAIRNQTTSPWSGYSNYDWCAWFATWCLRGATGGYYTTWAYHTVWPDMRQVGPLVSAPEVGDVVIFGEYHTGLVSQVEGGLRFIEGNPGAAGALNTQVVERPGWGASERVFRRPIYSAIPTQQRRLDMTTRYAKIGSGDGGVGTIVALAGDVGYPCPGNWQEYTRTVADGSSNDRAAMEYLVHGSVVWIPAAQWAALQTSYTVGGPTVNAPETISLSEDDRDLLRDIADKLSTMQPEV